jgi:hypothetical protein
MIGELCPAQHNQTGGNKNENKSPPNQQTFKGYFNLHFGIQFTGICVLPKNGQPVFSIQSRFHKANGL